jgi:hypothetical protein
MTFIPLTPSVGKEKRILEGPKEVNCRSTELAEFCLVGDRARRRDGQFNGWTLVVQRP